MGEIVIKVPGDVREEIELELPAEVVVDKLEELARKFERLKRLRELTDRYRGKLDIPEVSEEELYG